MKIFMIPAIVFALSCANMSWGAGFGCGHESPDYGVNCNAYDHLWDGYVPTEVYYHPRCAFDPDACPIGHGKLLGRVKGMFAKHHVSAGDPCGAPCGAPCGDPCGDVCGGGGWWYGSGADCGCGGGILTHLKAKLHRGGASICGPSYAAVDCGCDCYECPCDFGTPCAIGGWSHGGCVVGKLGTFMDKLRAKASCRSLYGGPLCCENACAFPYSSCGINCGGPSCGCGAGVVSGPHIAEPTPATPGENYDVPVVESPAIDSVRPQDVYHEDAAPHLIESEASPSYGSETGPFDRPNIHDSIESPAQPLPAAKPEVEALPPGNNASAFGLQLAPAIR